ncbi:hypothetical protein [Erythrobacter longus]|nr:hypothetical protein [Erythrobacter longus]
MGNEEMEREASDQKPSASTLWLAIGIGAFSVFASFFMAVYFAAIGTNSDTGAIEAQRLEASARPAD